MKVFRALVVLGLALLFQLRAIDLWSWSPEFVLATLITLAFFVTFGQLVLLGCLAAWLLAWQPGLGQEVVSLVMLPLAAYFVRRLSPWQSWLSNLVLVAGSIPAFYILAEMIPVLATRVFFSVTVATLAYTAVLFYILKDILGGRPDQKEGIFA